MTFQDLEASWAQQTAPAAPDLNQLKRSLDAELGTRRRTLIYIGFGSLLGLIGMQAIFVAGMRAPQLEAPWVSAARLVLHQVISLALLYEVVRAYRRHRRLARSRTATVREVLGVTLANVESTLVDFGIGKWIVSIMAVHSVFSVYLNQVVLFHSWSGFGARLVALALVYVLIAVLAWRHYAKVLLPRRAELQATLRQMEEDKPGT